MKYTLNLRYSNVLTKVCSISIPEVLILSQTFSKSGGITQNELKHCLTSLREAGKSTILVWDLLCKDTQLEMLGEQLSELLPLLDAVRFSDPGVGQHLMETYPQLKLQLSLEKGTPNQRGILRWVDYFSSHLNRVILSNQLPLSQIRIFKEQIPVQIELAGIGRIETFYSPRTLLRPLFPDQEGAIEVMAASEDRPHQVSPLMETEHGTLLHYDKDLFVLDVLPEIEEAGINYLGLDFYEEEKLDLFMQFFLEEDWPQKLKENWPNKTTRGFLRANKTHAPLKRLSNQHLQKEKEEKIGTVLESVKKHHLLVETSQQVQLPLHVVFCSPEGKQVPYEIKWARNLQGEQLEEQLAPGLYLFPWVKYVVPATILKFRL